METWTRSAGLGCGVQGLGPRERGSELVWGVLNFGVMYLVKFRGPYIILIRILLCKVLISGSSIF